MKGDFNLEAAYALVLTCVIVISVLIVAMALSATCGLVGERAPSPSPVVTATARAGSEAAPARSLADGNGEDVVPVEGERMPSVTLAGEPSHQPEPASTVTQSALTATVTAYVVIDHVPATPPAQRVPVGSYDPWPPYLWPTVECIVQRESRGDPYAVGSAGERGLMQVHPITWGYLARYGITPDALFDPATNIRAAYLLYIEAGGLRPWGGGCA